MTLPHPLDLPFRGSRDYLQGADIYEKMLEEGKEIFPAGPLQIQFHTLLRRQPDMIWSQDSLTEWRNNPAYRGEAHFGPAKAGMNVVLLESERPITQRKECNEKDVVAASQVDVASKTATLPFPCCGTPMEMVVFLNKQLHFQVLPQVKEKWLFVKLDLSEALPEGNEQLILVMKQVLGNRFTRTEILVDGKSFGFITFSTAK